MDIRQAITDKIIAMLEKGGNEARTRWTKAAQGGFPSNGTTGDTYKGVNVLILWDEAIERGSRPGTRRRREKWLLSNVQTFLVVQCGAD